MLPLGEIHTEILRALQSNRKQLFLVGLVPWNISSSWLVFAPGLSDIYYDFSPWRAQLDADIILPDNFRRMLFNNSHLERSCLYGADRMDVIGREEMKAVFDYRHPQHTEGVFLHPKHPRALSPRYVDKLHGYVPLGYFGLWHASTQKPYPYSLGDASHDDIAFGILWPESCRRLLPSALLYHLCSEPPKLGQNWEKRTSKRLDDA